MPAQREPTRQQRFQSFRMTPYRDTPLAHKVTLAFFFMSLIPLLLTVWVLFSLAFPNLHGPIVDSLRLFVVGIILSIFIGYFVLKHTMTTLFEVVSYARTVTRQRLGETGEPAESEEIRELARAFTRITSELERKIEDLESSRELIKRLLSRLGTTIGSYEGIDRLLELIVENTAAALEADMGSLMLVDGEKQELEAKTALSATGRPVKAQRMRLGEGIAGWVAQASQPMRGVGAPAALGLLDGSVKEGAVLCVPLLIRDKPIGVLSLLREDAGRPFTEDDELLAKNIGAQVAVALENYRLNLDIERTYLEVVMALALAVEAKEPYTGGHTKRVAFYAKTLGEAMGLDGEAQQTLHYGGLLHDLGKIGVKDDILLKPAALTPEEWDIMRQHSAIGEAILKPVHSLRQVADLVRHHHERYDGTGYPDGLKGEAIPLGARILAVADAYDAMVTDRPYRKRLSFEQAEAEFHKCTGTMFDPAVVAVFLQLLAEKDTRLSQAPR